MAAPPIGARLSREISFDAAAIRATALHVGDKNPLHHAADVAAASRFGELIARGAYTSGLLAGSLSEGFADEALDGKGQVGVDYTVRFIAPVRVDRLMRFEWTVAELEPRRSGTIASLKGRIVDTTTDTVAVAAEMKLFYFGGRRPALRTPPNLSAPGVDRSWRATQRSANDKWPINVARERAGDGRYPVRCS